MVILTNSFGLNAQIKKIKIAEVDLSSVRYKWLGEKSLSFTRFGLDYKKPFGFKEVSKWEWFEDNEALGNFFSSTHLISKDEQFIAFGPVFCQPLTGLNLTMTKTLFPDVNSDILINAHLYQLRMILRDYFGADVDWKEMLQFYPDDVAKKRFNADAAIRTSYTLRPKDYYKEDFKYVDIFLLYKKNRGFVCFYCVYTDRAQKKLKKYWKRIEGVLKFEKNFVMKD